MATDLPPEKRFLRGPVYLFLGLGFLAMYLSAMPAGIIGAACLLLPLALILEPLGERIPILKDYLGGSPLLLIFLGAGLVHFKVLSPQVVESFGSFMKESGSNFLDFFICSLITGAIFGIHSKMLLKAGLRYAAPVAGGVIASCALLALVGLFTGRGWADLVLNIGFPILGGGIGGGAVPMASVVNGITGQDMKQIMSVFVPAVVLGYVFSIITGAFLNRLGGWFPALTGNGELMKDSSLVQEEPKIDFSPPTLIIGAAVACGFYALGKVLNHLVPAVHNLAWMVLAVALGNISGMIPAYIISGCYSWFNYAHKIRGATFLKTADKDKARDSLGNAYSWWMKYSNLMDTMFTGMKMQRSEDLPDWHFHDKSGLKEYADLGGVGIPDSNAIKKRD